MADEQKPKKLPDPEDLQAIANDMTDFMAGIRRERDEKPQDKLDTEIGQAAMRLVEDGEKPDAWTDIGGGDPRARLLERLKADITGNLMQIDEEYLTAHKGDRSIYKLHKAIGAVRAIADLPGMKIADYVREFTIDASKHGEQYRRNETIRLFDSLGLLQNVLAFTQMPDAEEREEQITQAAGSSLWQTGLKAPMLRALEDTYELIAYMTSPDADSVRGFLAKAQHELVRQGLGFRVKTRRDTGFSKYQRDLANVRALAWREFDQAMSEG